MGLDGREPRELEVTGPEVLEHKRKDPHKAGGRKSHGGLR